MTDTFTWPVTTESSGGGEFKTTRTAFGDGYSQEVANGLNNEEQKWSVVFVGNKPEVETVLAFIRAKYGAQSFYWKPPLGVQGFYRCKKYTPRREGGFVWTLTMEFEQVRGL